MSGACAWMRGLQRAIDAAERITGPASAHRCRSAAESNGLPGEGPRSRGSTPPRVLGGVKVTASYRIGENADGITSAFSCFTTTPGGFRAGHWPVAAAAARTLKRSFASL